MGARLRRAVYSSLGLIALVASASCSAPGAAAPSGVTGTKAPSSAHPVTVATDGLCSVINHHTVAAAVTGEEDADVLAVPLQVQSPQIAGCEYANPAELAGSVLDVTLAPAIQAGTDQFAELQRNRSFTQLNVNGFPVVGDIPDGITYLRFSDKDKTFTSGSPSVDSILEVHFKSSPADTTPLTADSYSVTLAEHAADDVSNGAVQKVSPVYPDLANDPAPMLTDDQGRQVSNPAEVVAIYDELLEGNAYALTATAVGITDPTDVEHWNSSQVPYLSDASVRAQVAKSMTVHPHCDDRGCVYPGFFVTGWNSPTARADGLKLGVDPTKVPDPRAAHVVPLYASLFPPSSNVGWLGMIPPNG